MRRVSFAWVCILAALTIGAAVAPATYAGSAPAPSLSPEAEVLTRQGITPARANQALNLQRQVAETHLASDLQAALASAYAGMWFDPALAQFHIGVTSAESRRIAEGVVASAGIAGEVVETPVRSTWAALLAAQDRWNRKIAKLPANTQATTGIDSPGNAVSVMLSSSLPSSDIAVLKGEAATESVNVSVRVASPSQLGAKPRVKKTCKEPFATKAAYCEETITSGVDLEFARPECTAGPMLTEGSETYLLTAGHCYGATSPANGEPIAAATFSKYPGVAGQKEIGNEGKWFRNTERDIAELKIKRPGPFTEALPNPVPALMAEWGIAEPKTPHAVGGIQAAEVTMPGQAVCHEGMTSGENCGEVKALNVTGPAGTEHLVEVTACGSGGDSGGPYFFRTGAGEILMMGTEVGGPPPECPEAGPYISKFEPLIGTPGVARFGILSTYNGQRLLTTATEVRQGPYWHVGGARFESGTRQIKLQAKGSTVIKSEIVAIPVTITCTASESEGATIEGNGIAQGQDKGRFKYSGCTINVSKCVVAEPITTKPLRSHLVTFKGGQSKYADLFEPTEGEAFATVKIEKGTEACALASTLELKGTVAAEIIPKEIESQNSLVNFPETQVTPVFLEGAEKKVGLFFGTKAAKLAVAYGAKLATSEKWGVFGS